MTVSVPSTATASEITLVPVKDDGIRAIAADDGVSGASGNGVITCTTVDNIVAGSAVYNIVTIATRQRINSGTTIECRSTNPVK